MERLDREIWWWRWHTTDASPKKGDLRCQQPPQNRHMERSPPFFAFLAHELAPREGRGRAAMRIAAACTITVAIAMVFRIPLAAYMAYMVFLTSKDDSAATVTMAVAGSLAITLAVILSLGLA